MIHPIENKRNNRYTALIIILFPAICLWLSISAVPVWAAQPHLEPVTIQVRGSQPSPFADKTPPQPDSSIIALTPEERAWLEAHPDIQLGYTDALPPTLIVDQEGRFSGVLSDILNALNKRLGTHIAISIDTIPNVLSKAKRAEIDGILLLHPDRADQLGLLKTEGVEDVYPTIFSKQPTSFKNLSDLKGKKIAVVDNIYYSEKIIQRYGKQATIIKVANVLEGMQVVQRGAADFFIGTSRHRYYIIKYHLADIAAVHTFFDYKTSFVMGIRPDWPELASVVNKGLSSFSQREINAIVNRWVGLPQKKAAILLTQEEQAWLDAHPDIQLGYTVAFEPEVIENPDGSYRGILVDILEELNRRLGTRIRLRIDPIPVLLEKAQKKETDGILSLLPSYADQLGLLKTIVYMPGYGAVFGPRNAVFDSPSDLAGKTVAIIEGVMFSQQLVEQYGDGATLLKVEDALEGLQLVDKGKADLFLGGAANAWLLTKYQFFGLKPLYVFYDNPFKGGMAIRPDWPELVSILNKGLSSFSEDEIETIVAKWIQLPVKTPALTLDPEEKAWLDQNHTVRVRATNWPPYLIVENDQPPQGIVIEYLDLIAKRTGITFDYEVTDQPFAEFLKAMQQRQGPDMSALITPTPEREQFLSFSQAYIFSPYVIFTREQDDLVMDISGLTGKTLAVPRGFTIQDRLTRDFPEIRLSLFDSDEQALQAVATGRADAYIGSLTAASHIIHKRGFEDLRVAAPSPFGEQSLSMGNRNDWPELTSIIDKALASLTEEEKTAILTKYVALRYQPGINKATALKWVLIVVGGAFGIIALFFIWNRSLARRVRQHTSDLVRTTESLTNEITERNKVEAALLVSRQYTDNLIETANVMIVGLDAKGIVNLFNPAAERITGYSFSELHGKNWFEFLTPKDQYPQVHAEFSRLMVGGVPRLFQNPILTKIGEERVISWSNNKIKEGDQNTGILSFGLDITERMRAEQEIQQYQGRLKALAYQLTVAEERERRRIAGDLHDQIGQTLALARLQLAQVRKSVPGGGVMAQVDELSDALRQAARDTQQLVFDLSSPSMNELGLAAAISEWLQEKVGKRYPLKTKFSQAGGRIPLSADERAILFRNVRELLTNVIKHARANQVHVSMEYTAAVLSIVVRDDGIGFDYRSLSPRGGIQGGFGLFSVRERMTDFGGTLEIDSAPGKGCRAVMTIPVEEKG